MSRRPSPTTSHAQGNMAAWDASVGRAGALGPLTKRHVIDGLPGAPEGMRLGWAQLPAAKGRGFSLGVFPDRFHFSQIALADGKGRVFIGSDPHMDTHDMEPQFLFGREEQLSLPDGPRFGHDSATMAGRPHMVEAISGGIVGRDDNGRLVWLASWIRANGRYTLEQMRADLPRQLRVGLEYRDAIAIAFFATYLLPRMQGLLLGFGSGNIFRRLGKEAPIGAIRRSVRDTMEARAHGMRASGLEDHFADLMREAGALDRTPGLEPVHGAEPLHLYTSSYSGCYCLTWNNQMAYEPALRSLRIEGNLNRFAAVSAWLERNMRIGAGPTEDTVTRAEAAQIDMALLNNPALLAFKPEEHPGQGFDPVRDDGIDFAWDMVGRARLAAQETANDNPDPAGPTAESEWVYRQTMSMLLRQLRLPFRFDVDFRDDLAHGIAALALTAAGAAMMPSTRYDEATHGWVELDGPRRAAMSAAYNLRVGLMMVALAFGASEQVRQVSLRIDSIGLEEAVAEQDTAISELMNDVLVAFERMHSADLGSSGSKADPKDGDVHGDPSRTLRALRSDAATEGRSTGSLESAGEADEGGKGADGPLPDEGVRETARLASSDAAATAGAHAADGAAAASTDAPDGARADESPENQGAQGSDDDQLERQFEELMRGGEIDETVFSMPPDGGTDGSDGAETNATTDGEDPMDVLRRSPTVRNLVTVTFTRQTFLARYRADGLSHPHDTYRMFDAALSMDGRGALNPIDASFDLRDARFSPQGSQEEPELASLAFDAPAAKVLGTKDAIGLSIQRDDLLQRAVADFHRLAADPAMPTVAKAQEAMAVVKRIGDPELNELAPQATSALIDGNDTPDFVFALSDELDRERGKAKDLLFSGRADQAVQTVQAAVDKLDALYASGTGVPRYFNSYAERVVYNRLFATSDENTVLIPDNLFYAHMELGELLAQISGSKDALPHLNAMVKYAPAYPLSHMKLAVQLARGEDWDSARAACLNALRVALDREDAAFAYYRFAYAEWMQDRFDTAAAAYIMADHISPGRIGALEGELRELIARADSQCIPVPDSVEAAEHVLDEHDLPVWPRTEVADIVRDAARVTVDRGLFVPARTLSVASARMADSDPDGMDVVQAQFLRSLSA